MSDQPIIDYRVKHAEEVIRDTYGQSASVDSKKKDLRKWGENTEVGTALTSIMTLPTGITAETYISTNGITTIVSTSASDTQNITFYEGNTISGSDLTFVNDSTVTALTGQTGVTLNTPVARITRARLSSPAVGTIYFYEGGTTTAGVPDDLSTVHMIIPAGEMQSQKAATSISSNDYYIISGATATVLEKTSAWAQVRIEIKPVSESNYFPITEWVGVSDSSGSVPLIHNGDPFLIVPSNHDVRLAAKANTSGIHVAGGMIGYLAKKI